RRTPKPTRTPNPTPIPTPTTRACRRERAWNDRGGGRAAGRSDPGSRAGALRVREAFQRQGAALLAGVRPAPHRVHLRRDRVPPVGAAARGLRAPARRGSGRADLADRSPARAGREAAVAAVRGRRRGTGVQPALAVVHLL